MDMESTQEIKDIGDSVKLEASVLSPKEDAKVKSMLEEASRIIEGKFAQFIPDTTKQKAKIAAYNTAIVEDADFLSRTLTNSDLGVTDPIMRGNNNEISGISYIFVSNPSTAWSEIDSDSRESFINFIHKQYGSVDPETMFNSLQLRRTLAHELGHSYHTPHLTKSFEEVTANYISEIVLQKYIKFVPSPSTKFVEELVSKYGDEVFKVMFGSCNDEIAKFKILGELTPEKVKELMPERVQELLGSNSV